MFGGDGAGKPVPGAPPPPAVGLTDALVPALQRPPCAVAFSGGRDSSLVLAAATAAARREGLAPPVAITLRFPGAPDSEETEWQQRVIGHLGVTDWVRLELPEGLDVIGPSARRLLLEHGPFYPANAHLVEPMLDHVAGGTIVSGLGGDELFGLWERRRVADVAARRARPRWSDAAPLAAMLAPPRVRMHLPRRRRLAAPVPWLRPAAQAELDAIVAEQHAHSTSRWDRHVLAVPGARSLALATRDIGRIAAVSGADFRVPLLDPGFTAALAVAGGWRGFGGRGATLRALFSELLPDDVLGRRSKATFNDAFFTTDTRRFAEQWSGRGLDESVVDPIVLRAVWRAPRVDYRSALLLQRAWLHDQGAVPC